MALEDPRLRLVLVDDHEQARAALVKRLHAHPQVLVAGHTADPLEVHELVQGERPHVALVDTVREDRQGARIISSLAALPQALRPVVIVHLSYYQPEHWAEAREAGADDLILKQIGVQALFQRLLLATQRVLPPERWPEILHA